jgi:glycerol uptake facilitator protein
MIGLSVTGLVLVLGPLTGAAVNPARAFGPNAVAALFGGRVEWTQYPAYVIGSLLGGLAAAFGYDFIARPRDAEIDAEPEVQGTQGEVVGKRV